MSIRPALTFALISVTAPFTGGAAATVNAAERPNIVFFFADDWGQYASAYRTGAGDQTPNAVVKTPNFDRIAREGVLFRNAFVPAPSCTPCRSAILSGQYFFRTGRGAILRTAMWDSAIPTFPLMLRDRGYHIGHTYKVWTPGTPRNAGFGGEAHAYNRAGRQFNRYSQFVSSSHNISAARETLLAEVRQNFYSFLADRRDDQPFCYWFGPTNVHRTWTEGSAQTLWDIDPDDLQGKLPPFLPDTHVVRQDMADYLGEIQAFDMAVGALMKELEKTGELDNTLVVVSGDHGAPGFPRGKCNLYDFGVQVALAVRWPAKVSAGRTVDDFVNLFDLAPTFLEAAGVTLPDVMAGRSLIPVVTSDRQGQVDPTRDHVVTGRERHVDGVRPGRLPYPQRAIRTASFLYIRNFTPDRWPMGVGPGMGAPAGAWPSYEELESNTFVAFGDLDASPTKAWIATHRDDPGMASSVDFAFGRRPAEELYQLSTDPHQMQNLADDPTWSAVKQDLSDRLLAVLTGSDDPRVTGDGSTFDRPPFTNAMHPSEQQRKNIRRHARPNIVVFLSDDHGYFDSSVYGSRVVRTPNMQRLADQGTTFTGTFAASPSGGPSRAVLYSGLYPSRNGAEPNHSSIRPAVTTLPTWLKEQGYRIALAGKSHLNPRHQYDFEFVPDSSRHNGRLDDDLLPRSVDAFLADHDKSVPLCLFACSYSPQASWPANQGYDKADVELPPAFVDTPETREFRTRYYTEVTRMDQRLGEVHDSVRRHLGENTLFIYTSDHGARWPFAKWNLYDAGIRVPMLATWPGMLEAGSHCSAMISFADFLPTFVVLAGGVPSGFIDGRSFARVLYGLIEHHRIEIYATHSGDGTMNVYTSRCVRTETHKYILNLHPEFEFTTHIDRGHGDDGLSFWPSWERAALKDLQARRIVDAYHIRPAEELFDVQRDPHETRNLATDPAYRRLLENFRGKVRAWMLSQDDQGRYFNQPRLLSRRRAG